MKLILVAGVRPNFMKIAPIHGEIQSYNATVQRPNDLIHSIIVHTGQHYDYEMSRLFFKDLEIPEPNVYLGVGSGSHNEQTAKVMIEFEKVLDRERPDIVVVVGDVNSTLACALATAKWRCTSSVIGDKRNYRLTEIGKTTRTPQPLIAHVEAGLRSFDPLMPEEINRRLTDALSDLLFTPSPDADENLKREGIPAEKIFLVGNIMVDSLLANKEKAQKSKIVERLGLTTSRAWVERERYGAKGTQLREDTKNTKNPRNQIETIIPYAVLTLHRPSNVDNPESLLKIFKALKLISKSLPIICPIHPRTRKSIERFGLANNFIYWDSKPIRKNGLYLLDPLGYLDFISLEMQAQFVLTDSGGIQEETTVLNVPCLTLRDTTERPITISQGTNILVGTDTERIVEEALKILEGKVKQGEVYELWDGRTAKRIVNVLIANWRSNL